MEENENRYGKLQWFFYIILVPTIFTVILVGIIFSFLGYDVVEAAKSLTKNIPIVSSLVQSDEDENTPELSPSEKLELAQTELSTAQAELETLKTSLQKKDMEILELEQRIKQREESEERAREIEESTAAARAQQNRELAELYGSMSAKRAAAILEKLTLYESALIVKEMDSQQRTALMAKFDPAFAANLTVTLKELELVEDPEMAALQERVQALIGMLDEKVEDGQEKPSKLSMNHLANTFTKLPAAQAANILEKMSEKEKEFKLAATILAVMSDETRSSIFAVMDPEIAIKYTNALAS